MVFDFTLPGYNYCGPGTKTKTAKPVNTLDEYCMEHDQFYEKHQEIESRQIADKILAKLAWYRFSCGNVSLCERFVALMVFGAMTIKLRLYK